MPAVTVEVRKHYSREQEAAIIDALHQAMMEALKTPQWDKNIRLVVHEPHRFASPPGKDERYTLVNVDLFAGRSIDAKRAFYQAIVRNLAGCGIPEDHVLILLREAAPENWGVRGGKPASEVDIGFEINI